MRVLLIAAVLLAGCDGAPAAPTAALVSEADPKRVEAAKACAVITGHRPGSTDELLANEYRACVAAVMEDKAPELRGRRDAPA